MKTKIFTSALTLSLVLVLSSVSLKDKVLKQTIVLTMPAGDGSNAAGVAYNPQKKMYYSVFAGNEKFPISVFSSKGKLLKSGIYTGFDVRGFWYNAKTNAVEGNGHGVTDGYWSKKIESSGFPEAKTDLIFESDEYDESEYQPDNNSSGAFNALQDEVYFLSESNIYIYNRNTGEFKSNGEIKNLPSQIEDLNSTTLVYTGIPKMEFGVLDFTNKKIYLINANGYFVTKTINLPKTAVVYEMFNFSYCNGIYWLFDKTNRKWVGYK